MNEAASSAIVRKNKNYWVKENIHAPNTTCLICDLCKAYDHVKIMKFLWTYKMNIVFNKIHILLYKSIDNYIWDMG